MGRSGAGRPLDETGRGALRAEGLEPVGEKGTRGMESEIAKQGK